MKKTIILFFLFYINLLQAQTKVQGKILDNNNQPIPYANVTFKNSKIGAYTNQNGDFSLESEKDYSVLEVSHISFSSKEIQLTKKITHNLKVILTEEKELQQVVMISKPKKRLSKKENPAYKILQKIWEHKNKNGLNQVNFYQYKKHSITELGLNHLDSTFLKKTLNSNYQEITKILSEKKSKNSFSMPFFYKEEVENIFGNNKEKKERIDIEGEQTEGIAQNGFGMERISRVFRGFDIYQNTILLLDKPFVSPISEFGYNTYSYVLNDSIIEPNNQKFYTIYFFPHQEQDLAFRGKFVVNNKNYAVKNIEMHTTEDTNLNLVRNLSFEKHFKTINDSISVLEKEIYEGDFTLLTKNANEKGMYVRKNIFYSDYQLNKELPLSFYQNNIIKYKANQFIQRNSYWDSISIEKTEILKTKNIISQIGNNSKIKQISQIINFLGTGFIDITNFAQMGQMWETYSTNDIENNRFKLGFRSFLSQDDRFRSYIYTAFGSKDRKIKYGISGKYLLFHQPRITLGGAFQDDYLQLGSILLQDETILNFKNHTNFWLARGENYFLTHHKKSTLMTNFSLLNSNLHFTFTGEFKKMKSAKEDFFSIAYNNTTNYSDATISFTTTYTPNRNVYGYGVEQRYGKNLFSLYKLKYTKGLSGVFGSSFNYTKLESMAQIPFPTGALGTLETTIEIGKIWGKVPITLLSPIPANQTFSLVNRTFSLVNYYDFINDSYLNLYFEHHFNGFIFNRIPLLRKTKWRSIAFARMAIGDISESNKTINTSTISYNLLQKPYWEYGFGIENIGFGNLRPFRVDFIWRNNSHLFLKHNPNFGIRIGIKPNF